MFNDKNSFKILGAQSCRLHNLLVNSHGNSVTSHNPGKLNFPCYILSAHEKSLPRKVLNFAVPSKNINHADFFYLLHGCISISGF